MPNQLMFTWGPMAVEECMSALQMMVDCELVLTVTEDGFERSVSGSARVHAFTGEKAGGTCFV